MTSLMIRAFSPKGGSRIAPAEIALVENGKLSLLATLLPGVSRSIGHGRCRSQAAQKSEQHAGEQ